ncbi:MAG: sulfate ABC transporter permease subunit CysT [Chitinophagaceae bacterium]
MILENMLLNNKIANRFGLSAFMMMVVIPFAAGLLYALLYTFGFSGVLANGFTWMHVSAVMKSTEVLRSIGFSFFVAITAIIISLAVALPAVIAYHQTITESKKSFIVYLPLAIPAIVTAFVSFQLLGKTGLLSRLFYQLHIINDLQQFPDLINDKFGIGIIATHVLMAVPFFLIFFSNLFVSERLAALSNAAASLGATKRQVMYRMVLPVLLKRGLTTVLLYFIFVLGSYEIPLILGQQSPQMISVLIVRKMQRYNLFDIPQGYFLSCIYSLFIILLLFIFLRPKKINSL